MFLDNKFLSKSKIFHLYMLTSERFFFVPHSQGKYAFSKKNYMYNGMVWSFSLHLYPYIGYFNEGRNSVRRSFETGIK